MQEAIQDTATVVTVGTFKAEWIEQRRGDKGWSGFGRTSVGTYLIAWTAWPDPDGVPETPDDTPPNWIEDPGISTGAIEFGEYLAAKQSWDTGGFLI